MPCLSTVPVGYSVPILEGGFRDSSLCLLTLDAFGMMRMFILSVWLELSKVYDGYVRIFTTNAEEENGGGGGKSCWNVKMRGGGRRVVF